MDSALTILQGFIYGLADSTNVITKAPTTSVSPTTQLETTQENTISTPSESILEFINNILFYNHINDTAAFDYKYKKILSIARLLLIAFLCFLILTPIKISGSDDSTGLAKTPNIMVLKQVFLYWVDVLVFFLLLLELSDFHSMSTKIQSNTNDLMDNKQSIYDFFLTMFKKGGFQSTINVIASFIGVALYISFHTNAFLVNYIPNP